MTIRWNADPSPDDLMLRIPAAVLAASVQGIIARKPAPQTVTQQNVFEVFGLRSKTYLRLARAGKFPNNKIGSLRIALYEDVRAFLTCRPDMNENPTLHVANLNHRTALETMAQSTKGHRR
jgi:hypothetical protein